MQRSTQPVRRSCVGILGIGLDSPDGHVRLTWGDNFVVMDGSDDTHRDMQRTIQQFNDELARRGIRLEDATSAELDAVIEHILQQE